MNEQTVHVPYKVSLLGLVAGTAALAMPYLSASANRIVAGQGYPLVSLAFPAYTALLITGTFLGAISVALAIRRKPTSAALISLVAGAVLFIGCWMLLGAAGTSLIPDTGGPGRVSPAAGFWLILAASYVYLNNGMRQLARRPSPLAAEVVRAEESEAPERAPSARSGRTDREPTARTGKLVSRVVAIALIVFISVLFATGYLSSLGVVKEFRNQRSRFLDELLAHLSLTGSAVLAAVVIGVPLGIVAWKRKSFERPVFLAVNGIQTIPSLALFGIMIAPLAWLSREFPVLRQLGIQGIGNAPALIALTLYALLPITRNTYTSLSIIDRAVTDAATGMGMGRLQLLRFVEVPLSLPIILGGIRISAVQAVGNTAVAALIGAGGLGAFVFQGLGQAAPDLILLGVFPIILLAVLVDRLMKFLVDYLTPGSMRRSIDEGDPG